MPGLVVRKDNGDLHWYPLFRQDQKFTFYPSKDYGQRETGFKVGRGFNFEKYLPGFWMTGGQMEGRRRIGGGNSLVVAEKDGDLKFYRFENETFLVSGTGDKVGKGFKSSWDFYVAEWMANGTSDLLVRDEDGDLRLFPWDGKEFRDLGRSENVGKGFKKDKYPDLFPGYWRGGKYPDLVAREENGSLWLYPFNGESFRDAGDRERIGRGFGDQFTHFLIDEWMQNGTPDMIVRDKGGSLKRYVFGRQGNDFKFEDGPYETVGKGFHDDWTYLVGHWRMPGKPDLILRDDDDNMRFYPFDEGEFTDLPKGDKYIGKGWKFTHFWDFYPI
ncbi:MAG: hypothetical protein ACFFEF_08780 [Candidatus Thorarchaeota archaeon]